MKTYPGKFFDNTMQGANQTGDDDAGAMIAILKSCLVTGFGALTPSTLIFDADNGWAKASFGSGHSYKKDSIIDCSGSAVADYNGEHRVMKVTTNDAWFELDTIPGSDSTGVITIKVAPLGWSVLFESGTSEVVIFSTTNELGKVFLHVDNTAYSGWSGTYDRKMKVAMIENVTDINTYDTIYECEWAATGRYGDHTWDLHGTSTLFFLSPAYGAASRQPVFVAGYMDSNRPGDEYNFIVNGLNTDANSERWDLVGGAYGYYTSFGSHNTSVDNVLARSHDQLVGVSSWRKRGMGSYGSDLFQYPDVVTRGFYINSTPLIIQEGTNAFRGTLPMVVEPLANHNSLHRKVLSDLVDHEGKTFRLLSATYSKSSDVSESLIGFDISTVEV